MFFFVLEIYIWTNTITYGDCALICAPKCSFDVIIWSFICLFFLLSLPSLPPTLTPLLPSLSPAVATTIIVIIWLSGLSPAQAEFNYLNTARTLELYGVELHYARVSKLFFMHACLHLRAAIFVSCWNMTIRFTFFIQFIIKNCTFHFHKLPCLFDSIFMVILDL